MNIFRGYFHSKSNFRQKSTHPNMYCMALKVYTCQEAAGGPKTFLNIFCQLLQQNEPSPAWQWSWFQYQLTLVYTASRRPAQHLAAIDNHYGAEVILSTICSHSRWRVEEDIRVINLRFSSGLILCCEGTANWSVQWSVQDYISLNNGLDICWNKYLKKKDVIVSLPTWLCTQKPTYLNNS
jgi:hypothetical protein